MCTWQYRLKTFTSLYKQQINLCLHVHSHEIIHITIVLINSIYIYILNVFSDNFSLLTFFTASFTEVFMARIPLLTHITSIYIGNHPFLKSVATINVQSFTHAGLIVWYKNAVSRFRATWEGWICLLDKYYAKMKKWQCIRLWNQYLWIFPYLHAILELPLVT